MKRSRGLRGRLKSGSTPAPRLFIVMRLIARWMKPLENWAETNQEHRIRGTFSVEVAKAWEKAFFSIATPKTRQVALRSAMTFSPDHGGVFDVFSKLVRHGLGGTNSPGTQFVSWIHEVDFTRTVEFLIGNPAISGPINVASPHPLPNSQFLRILRKAWGARFGVPTPPWMLEIGTFLLRTESELVLKSRRVVPGRLLDAGFAFSYPRWEQAAPDLVARSRRYAL